jgi:transcriptional regulator with XRE-family HTH domain
MLKHAVCQVGIGDIMQPETGKAPNKYTIGMGKLIKTAREEAGLSQEELAEKIYRKRLAVSEMENGKVEISAWTIPYLAGALNKSISYFYPNFFGLEIPEDKLNPLEYELLIYFRQIWSEHLQKVVIDQVKVMSKFNPEEMLIDSIDILADKLQHQDDAIEYFKNRKRKKDSLD